MVEVTGIHKVYHRLPLFASRFAWINYTNQLLQQPRYKHQTLLKPLYQLWLEYLLTRSYRKCCRKCQTGTLQVLMRYQLRYWSFPVISCIIFHLENPHCRGKWYVEYNCVLSNSISQWNLWRNITFSGNHMFVLRNSSVLQLRIFTNNRTHYCYAYKHWLLKLKVCKRDELFKGWVFSIAFLPIAFLEDDAFFQIKVFSRFHYVLLCNI